jgi:hypothetical protein
MHLLSKNNSVSGCQEMTQTGKQHVYFDENCECRECLLKRQCRVIVPLEEFYGYRWNKKKFGKAGVTKIAKLKKK